MFRVFLVHSEHSSTIRTRHLTAVSLQLVHGALSLLEGCFHGRFHIAMMSRGVERYHHMIDIPYLDPRKSLFGDAYCEILHIDPGKGRPFGVQVYNTQHQVSLDVSTPLACGQAKLAECSFQAVGQQY